MRAQAGTLAVAAIILGGAFGLALLAGFVYSHEPQPERVDIRVDSSRPPDAEQVLPGTVTRTTADSIEVTTILGAETVALEGLVAEDLVPLDEDSPTVGAPANIGGTRTQTGYVLSGVVIIETDASSGGLAP